MFLKSLAVLALSAAALAAEEKRQVIPTDSLGFSVLSVLATAIPQSEQSAARANATAFALSVASSISAGTPPSWYQALPSDVKSYLPILYPVAAPASTTAAPTSAPTSSVGTASVGTGSTIQNVTVSSVSSATLGTTGGANSEAPSSTGGSASTSGPATGAAAYPTAVVGAGVAGALGFVAMLAL
ncbi:hypothetical protein BDV96DRAFT_565553 [Lophiotrema nucula]|uniref:Ser-Thr-rich glycosyl-phosphatidyl-inositol-anchored membrane family-domain-containing protein n=1 Tax=Lophiotrema nucula TaxID=690887 RepID=A0A6A5ZN15_9PLEO|nr:hypothetical protein BDV96DRAFT_565553 [Lophiotrema nucula]